MDTGITAVLLASAGDMTFNSGQRPQTMHREASQSRSDGNSGSSPRCWRRSRCSRPFGHRFWAADPAQFTNQLYNFLKNLAIIGAFIALFLADRKNAPRA